MRRALEARLDLERGEDLLDHALRAEEAAAHDPAEAPRLVGSARPVGEVDVRDLEQRDAGVAHVDVVTRGAEEARRAASCGGPAAATESGSGSSSASGCGSSAAASTCTPRRSRSRRARLRPSRRSRCSWRQPAEHRLPIRKRRRHLLEPEARHLLDEVDLASHVAGTPRGNGDLPGGVVGAVVHRIEVTSKPSRSSRAPGKARRTGMPTTSSARSGRKPDDRPFGEVGLDVGAPVQRAPASSTRSSVAWTPPARRARAQRPSPSASAHSERMCRRSPLRSTPSCSKFAASSSTVCVSAETSLSAPPMIPATATGRSASAITRSSPDQRRARCRRACGSSRPARRGGRRSALRELRVVERVQRVARARASRSS